MSLPPEQPANTPPYSTSPYRWQWHPSPHPLWWRTIDSMANFVLHWQTRFHGHGDMFASCTLSLTSASCSSNSNPNSDSTLPTSSTSKSNAIPTTSSSSLSSSSYFTSAAMSSNSSSPDVSQIAPHTFPPDLSPNLATSSLPFELAPAHLREALRRLRFTHPTIALRLASRRELNLPLLAGIPPLLERNVDFQLALVYDVITCAHDLEGWLDETIVWHDAADDAEDWGEFIIAATADGVPPRDRLRVHYWPSTGRMGVEQSHAVSDGVGTLILFDLLLSSLAPVISDPTPSQLDWGEEVVRLEPAVWDALADPPRSSLALGDELKRVRRVNASRMHGKSTPPNAVERMVGRLVAFALARESRVGRGLTYPLIALVRQVVGKGKTFPLGLLPPNSPASKRTHTGVLYTTLSPTQTTALLTILKTRGLTLAPFLEAVAHMATTWVRAHRRLAPHGKWDKPTRLLGSFSNAVSQRPTLRVEHARYLGLCMSGFPTSVAASAAAWSTTSQEAATFSPTHLADALPHIADADRCKLWALTSELACQYKEGRARADWLQVDEALLWETMRTEYRLMREEGYPSMVWLSSLGRVEAFFRASHPVDPLATPNMGEAGATGESGALRADNVDAGARSEEQEGARALEGHDLRLVGRVGIRQPILHVYTFHGTTTIQLSFADWLYSPAYPDSKQKEASEMKRQNILAYWLQVFITLIDAILLDEAHSPMVQ